MRKKCCFCDQEAIEAAYRHVGTCGLDCDPEQLQFTIFPVCKKHLQAFYDSDGESLWTKTGEGTRKEGCLEDYISLNHFTLSTESEDAEVDDDLA